jgi:Lon protease-like protein
MVFDALKTDRMIGMVQPRPSAGATEPHPVYEVGCAGRIAVFNETEDGRLLIGLRGVCRFRVREELACARAYRRVLADWSDFAADLGTTEPTQVRVAALRAVLDGHLQRKGLEVRWDQLESLPPDYALDFLCLTIPLQPQEKQALLEAPTASDRASILETIIRFDAAGGEAGNPARH